MTAPNPFPGNWAEGGQSAHSEQRTPPSQLIPVVLPAGAVTLACVVAAAIVLLGHPSVHTLRVVLAAVTFGTLVLLAAVIAAPRAAGRAARRAADAELRTAREVAQRGQADLQQMVDRLMHGKHPVPPATAPVRVPDGSPLSLLVGDIQQVQYQAAQGVLQVADRVHNARGADQRVEIFVNLAMRMQSLVHREIEMLDDLEAKVEDPDLLKGLFTVDHLATRLRRQSESLAVLGGASSRRQWTRQVTMHEVLRAAVAEVEHYSRVKVVPPVEGVLRGPAVTDVIHLVAELVENATKFSAPQTIVLLRVQYVSAGVAVEVEDRGLGMPPDDQQRRNGLLADPTRMDVDELLRDGRIGLYVVASLARRHAIRVQLQNNIYGGTQAVVVLPEALLEPADDRALPGPAPDRRDAAVRLAPAAATVPAGGAQAGSGLPRHPAREQVPPEMPAAYQAARVPGSLAPAGAPGGSAAPREGSVRPQLPRRQPQSSVVVAVERRHADQRGDASTARATEPPADQMTDLAANFLRGVRSAEEENSPVRD